MENKFDPRPEFRLFLVDMLEIHGKGAWVPVEENKSRMMSISRRLFALEKIDIASDLVKKINVGGFVSVGNGYRFQIDVNSGQRYVRFERDN